MSDRSAICAALLLLMISSAGASIQAELVPVRHPQGSAHGFLELKTLEGKPLAVGDVTQTVRGDRVTSRLTFRFQDGSLDDETTVFSQRSVFRLISDHHVQRGRSFPKPINVWIDSVHGEITSVSEDGTRKQEHMNLPEDLSNGLPPNLLMNLLPSVAETKISYLAPGAKPRLVHLTIKNGGEAAFAVGGRPRKALDYVVHVELGGVEGVIAPIVGKQPDDVHIWVLPGSSPAFIREEGQFYEGGPVWRVEQISPTFTR